MNSKSSVSRRTVIGGLASIAATPLLTGSHALAATLKEAAGQRVAGSQPADARARFLHAATTLRDGRIVVTGGYYESDKARQRHFSPPSASTQLYDPFNDEWYDLAPMNIARARHASVLLPDGRIAVVGGYGQGPLRSIEFYDSSRDLWEEGEGLPSPLFDHTASVVGGRLVLTGGAYGAPATSVSLGGSSSAIAP